MKFREIKAEKDLEIYRHAIATHIDVLLPQEYLKQGRVFGYYNKKGEICGGFAMITQGPFRVLESIPDFSGLHIDPNLKRTAEITGVWLSASGRDKFSSLRFWFNIIAKVLTSRKRYFVYAYSSRKAGLEKIYSRANPIVLFRGETKLLPGMPSPDHESVEVVLKSRVIVQVLKNPDFFVKRIISSQRKKAIKTKDTYETRERPILPIISTGFEFSGGESKINRR